VDSGYTLEITDEELLGQMSGREMFVQTSTSPLLLSKGVGLSSHSAEELFGDIGLISVELAD
jgi:hypothetical protein